MSLGVTILRMFSCLILTFIFPYPRTVVAFHCKDIINYLMILQVTHSVGQLCELPPSCPPGLSKRHLSNNVWPCFAKRRCADIVH